MGKWNPTAMLDAALDWIDTNYDETYLCDNTSSGPTTYAEATVSNLVGYQASTGTMGSPATGDAGGQSRKVAVTAVSSISCTASATITHVALVKDASSVLAYVTTCSSKAVSASDKVNMPAWDIEIAAAT